MKIKHFPLDVLSNIQHPFPILVKEFPTHTLTLLPQTLERSTPCRIKLARLLATFPGEPSRTDDHTRLKFVVEYGAILSYIHSHPTRYGQSWIIALKVVEVISAFMLSSSHRIDAEHELEAFVLVSERHAG